MRMAEKNGMFQEAAEAPTLSTSPRICMPTWRNFTRRTFQCSLYEAEDDSPHETQGQVEVGYRYFERAAAGAVMIGEAPDCEAYRELFGWPEAVIEIQPDGSDIMAVLSAISSDPKRMAAISTRNVKEALRRHDWLYRWKEMFRVVSVEPTPRMVARERRLNDMADFAANKRH